MLTSLWILVVVLFLGILFWILNANQRVTINILGFQFDDIPVCVATLGCVFWIFSFFIIYWMESCCRSIGGCDEIGQEITNLQLDVSKLRKEEQYLAAKLKELQTVAKRIEMMVPYNLNTIIDQKMFDAIPHVTYNPTARTIASGVQFSDIALDRPKVQVIPNENTRSNRR